MNNIIFLLLYLSNGHQKVHQLILKPRSVSLMLRLGNSAWRQNSAAKGETIRV